MTDPFVADYFTRHQAVVRDSLAALQAPAVQVARVLIDALRQNHKVLAFGNGGSATQASHFAGELLGRFARPRRPLPALALPADMAVVTCVGNDFGVEALFERQIAALAHPGDVVLGLTTSGRSPNVLRGLAQAREIGTYTVALTGEAGLARGSVDALLAVPTSVPAHVQEIHLMLLHAWCVAIDDAFG